MFHSFVVAKHIFLWKLPQLHRCNWQLLVVEGEAVGEIDEGRVSAIVVILDEVFTLPHVIHMDSTGLHWTPVDSSAHFARPNWLVQSPVQSSPVQSTGLTLDCKPLFRVQSQSSGLRVQSKSSGVQWSPVDSTGILPIVLIVIKY